MLNHAKPRHAVAWSLGGVAVAAMLLSACAGSGSVSPQNSTANLSSVSGGPTTAPVRVPICGKCSRNPL